MLYMAKANIYLRNYNFLCLLTSLGFFRHESKRSNSGNVKKMTLTGSNQPRAHILRSETQLATRLIT
jgi:hypothetical protein